METFNAFMDMVREAESNFNSEDVLQWHSNHTEVPIFACCLYFLIVFWLPGVLEANNLKFKLTGLMIVWNLLLAGFSFLGASRVVPALIEGIRTRGFEGSVCDDSKWSLDGVSGLWICLFIYSKIPELVDTLFLVLKRRPVILLHWFHHCTVLLYCWHAYLLRTGPGIHFAAMNFSVHSIMYTYYAAMAARLGGILAPIAPLITGVQILQMLGGMIVIVVAARRLSIDGQCAANPANMKLGFAMYCSYFVLFGMLFYSKYVAPKACGKDKKTEPPEGSPKMVCGVDIRKTDAAGRFGDAGPTSSNNNGQKTNSKANGQKTNGNKKGN